MEALFTTALVHAMLVLEKMTGRHSVEVDWATNPINFRNDIERAYARMHFDLDFMFEIRAVRSLALITGRAIPDMKERHERVLLPYVPEIYHVCNLDGERLHSLGSVRVARALAHDLSDAKGEPHSITTERMWFEDVVLDAYDGLMVYKGVA